MLDKCLMVAPIYENSRPTDVSDYVRRHVGMHELITDGASDRALLRHATLGNLGLTVISYGVNATVSNGFGLDSYHLQFVINGTCTIRLDNTELILPPGHGTFINPRVPSSVSYSPDCVKLIVNVPAALFRASSIDRLGCVPDRGVCFRSGVYDIENTPTVARTIEMLYLSAAECTESAGASQAPLEMFFAAKMLDFFQSNVCHVPSQTADERSFSLIDSYIENHIKEDVGIDALAEQCHVSQRTLYDRFTHVKAMTPSAYIKKKKLRQIYQHLSDPVHLARNVTELALEYGFSHLGRFSAEYKALFSELPSETIRRTRAFQ